MPDGTVISFGDLESAASNMQTHLRKEGVGPGGGVLIFSPLSADVYAAIIAILGLGGHVIFVEPWLPMNLIDRAIELVKPKVFLSNLLGFAWGVRCKAIRSIPKWMRIGKMYRGRSASRIVAEAVHPETSAIITFTTGSTGRPKGIVRTQNFLLRQHAALTRLQQANDYSGADLCTFANFALANLATGRTTIVVPNRWDSKFFHKLEGLSDELLPQTLSCGPAFLRRLVETEPKIPLRSIHVGGGVTDCDLFEDGFALWPGAQWLNVYSSNEAEPVAAVEARVAVAESRGEGFFQTLFLGNRVPEIKARFDGDSLWVSGSHVCPFYLLDEVSNSLYKAQDEEGNIWHNMNDRVVVTESGWWYGGRNTQRLDDFLLEQKIYSYLQNSDSFIFRACDGEIHLLGDHVKIHGAALKRQFPELAGIHDLIVYRDKTHRSRIDREMTVKRGASWIAG